MGHLSIFKLLNGIDWLSFFVAKLIYWIFIQQHNRLERLEKEMKYKYLHADDSHSESNKGVYI